MITAKVIKDSSCQDERVVTLELRVPKIVDAQFEKHGLIASNSSSDRAKSFRRIADEEPYIMTDLRVEQKGMQGYEGVDPKTLQNFQDDMRTLRSYAIDHLAPYEDVVHHQHLNRYLLPWSMQSKVATANDFAWEGFLDLRAAHDADPIIKELADRIQEAIDGSHPTELKEGEWHLPYVDHSCGDIQTDLAMSAARCCKVSYDRHGVGSEKLCFELHDKLIQDTHLTPLEHQLTPITTEMEEVMYEPRYWAEGITHVDRHGYMWSGRHRSFIQYRKLVHPKWV